MITSYHIRLLIEECRGIGRLGLDNGISAFIPQLELDILKPPLDFIGVHNNPAIFVNKETYKLLGRLHRNWVENKTIVVKKSFLNEAAIDVLGAIIHETGHAFNVAANIENNEANAYIYEIEVMRKLYEAKSALLLGCSFADIQSFFKRRLAFYQLETSKSEHLTHLVDSIKDEYRLENETLVQNSSSETSSLLTNGNMSLFSLKQQFKERTMLSTRMILEF